jgi:TrmH family RNA methyltransferase
VSGAADPPLSAAGARLLTTPAGRRAAGRFVVEGPHAVAAAAERGLLLQVFATAAAAGRHPELLAAAPATVVSERTLGGLTGSRRPQGIVGVAALLTRGLDAWPAGPRSPVLVAVLVSAADPGNAGTVVRVADAAGADAVVFAASAGQPGVDPHNDKCVRASAGSVFHLPLLTADAPAAVTALRGRGLQVLAAAPDGERDLLGAGAGDWLRRPSAWLLGNEAHGLGAELAAAADARVRIPIYGGAQSLNLATAATLCLYASAQAQRGRADPPATARAERTEPG